MQKKFLLNILFLLAVNVLIKPFFIFGIDRGVQNTVQPADYGAYFTLTNFSVLFLIIVDFGIQNFNNRNIAQHPHLFTKYFSQLSLLKVSLSIIYGVLCWGVAFCFGGYSWTMLNLLFWIICNQILLSVILFLRSNISGLQSFFVDSLISIVDRVLLILICGVLLWTDFGKTWLGGFKIEHFVYAQTLVYAFTAFIATLALWRISWRERSKATFSWRWNAAFQMWLIRGSLPYAMAVFLMAIYMKLDAVMIERMLPDGADQTGLYAGAYRLLDASNNMLGYLPATLLMPMYARLLQEQKIGRGEGVLSLVRFSYKALIAVAIVLATGSYVFRLEIITLLYHGVTAYSGDLLGWLMLTFPAVCTMYVFGSLLSANNSMKQCNYVYLIGVVVSLILNFTLIPKFAALGAAWASCITQTIVGIGLILVSQRIFGWKTDFKLIFKIILFIITSFSVFYIFKNYQFFNDWRINLFAAASVCGLASLFFGLVDVMGLWKMRNVKS